MHSHGCSCVLLFCMLLKAAQIFHCRCSCVYIGPTESYAMYAPEAQYSTMATEHFKIGLNIINGYEKHIFAEVMFSTVYVRVS